MIESASFEVEVEKVVVVIKSCIRNERLIAQKYREGKLKRTLKRGFNDHEIAEVEAS